MGLGEGWEGEEQKVYPGTGWLRPPHASVAQERGFFPGEAVNYILKTMRCPSSHKNQKKISEETEAVRPQLWKIHTPQFPMSAQENAAGARGSLST